LPYLQELGVTALWLTPIYQNGRGDSYHGYWVADYYRIDSHLGELADFRRLVDRAHELGIKVIQDQVLNHTAPDHPWVKDAPTDSWWNGTRQNHLNNDYNIAALADRWACPVTRRPPLEGWFAGQLPDLNQNDPHVERYLIQNSLWWIAETGIDGIRLDAYPYVPRSFWRNWHREVGAQFPKLTAVGEVFHESPSVVSFFQGGRAGYDGIDTSLPALCDFPLAEALRGVLSGKQKMSSLPAILEQDRLYPNPAYLVTFVGNHDMSRLATLVKQDVAKIKLAHAILLTCRGVPQLYYGDEIGLSGEGDPDNRRDFPGGFPGDSHSAFDPAQRTETEKQIIEHWKAWVKVRKSNPALCRGELVTLFADDDAWISLRRTREEQVVVVLSKSAQPRRIQFPAPKNLWNARSLELLAGTGVDARLSEKLEINLSPMAAAVWRIKTGSK
jgi:glycosidase